MVLIFENGSRGRKDMEDPVVSATALLIRNGPLVHKYYINRVSLSHDYIH